MMKKRVVISSIVLIIFVAGFIFFSICSKSSKPDFVLNITESCFGKEITKKFNIDEHELIEFDGNWTEEITFEVIKIRKHSITIRTNTVMSLRDGENGGINLRAKEMEFVVEKNKIIILDTPTMDANASYRIELK